MALTEKKDIALTKAQGEVLDRGNDFSFRLFREVASRSGGGTVAGTPSFTADRPFVYVIRETSSGAVAFIGAYTGK